jgi:hypothetical protein
MFDHISCVLTDFKSNVQPHGSFGQAPEHGFKRLLRAIAHVFGVVIGMDSAKFVCGDKRPVRHDPNVVQDVTDGQLLA